jgi:hypothetical protein
VRRRAVVRALARHRGESGILVYVDWPLTYRHVHATTEDVVCVVESGRGPMHMRTVITRHRLAWSHRPYFQPLPSGVYALTLISRGLVERKDEAHVSVTVTDRGPVLLTCLPAKRRFLTKARERSEWSVNQDPLVDA